MIFIDELDRCRPDYAINYLETIKHVFDLHGLVFLLAIDHDQLEASAKSLFGEKLKFHDYFRKFSHRTIALPEPSDDKLHSLANFYVGKYIEKQGKRMTMLGVDEHRIKNIVDLVVALRMPPRQIQEMFRIIGHMLIASDIKHQRQLFWCIGVGTIFMSALKVANSPMYRRIGTGQAKHEEVGKYLIDLLGKKSAYWWFYIYLSAYEDQGKFEPLFIELGFNTLDLRRLQEISIGWGHSYQKIWWAVIYEKMESADVI